MSSVWFFLLWWSSINLYEQMRKPLVVIKMMGLLRFRWTMLWCWLISEPIFGRTV